MAKVQTRRCVSMNRAAYERLKAHCAANNISMSQFVESHVPPAVVVQESENAR